ncbi:MAG: SUMF1/EgtB/PvdO family nonheme iron enzyme, partial [Candidatus Methanofastidiosa archaeon]|nr:SUMF1/EgtB/PvdO family nonheme iron enzyme [Candidatus Methanofastidiosa archaeon]
MRKMSFRVLYCILLFLCMLMIVDCKLFTNNDGTMVEEEPTVQITPYFTSDTPTNGMLQRVLDGMNMISIPAGEFIMGTEGDKIEQQHLVYLDTYWIDHTEVTNGMYA